MSLCLNAMKISYVMGRNFMVCFAIGRLEQIERTEISTGCTNNSLAALGKYLSPKIQIRGVSA